MVGAQISLMSDERSTPGAQAGELTPVPAPGTKQSGRSQQQRTAAEERPGSTRRTDESMSARAERKASPREPDSSARAERKAAEREAESEPVESQCRKNFSFTVQQGNIHLCREHILQNHSSQSAAD